MTPLLIATWIALGVTAAAALACGLSVRFPRARDWASPLVALAWIATGAGLVLLVDAFLRGNLSVFYVWENLDTGYPWWLRMAGLWGGQAGTYLLWAFFVLGATAIEDRLAGGENWRRARAVLVLVAVVLLVPTVVLGLGQATDVFGLTSAGTFEAGAAGPSPLELRPGGAGLNPLLESVYMAIHPLVEFLAYGLTAVPFAYGLVHLFRGGPGLERARSWARPAWLAFLTALTLGSLWAYTVLSFGGYWIWDPVEVGNLLPFAALTLFLHAQAVHDRDEALGLLSPASAVLGFTLIVFSTFVVRSGLWSSVHAFLPTGLSIAIEDPTRRLLVAVDQSFQARFATGMASAAIGASAAGFAAYHARRLPEQSIRRLAAWSAVAAYGTVAVAGLVLTGPTVAALHRVALVLGLGNPLAGVVALVVLALAPLAAGLVSQQADPPVSLERRPGQLVLASALLAIAVAATTLLLVLGVNGYTREVFDARAPYIAGPILALAAVAFGPGRVRPWILSAGAALLAGAGLKLVTGSWAWAAAPVALATLAAATWMYVKRARPTRPTGERAQTLALVTAGVLGLVHWAWPGTVVLGSTTLVSPAWYVPVGLLASATAVLWPYLERETRLPGWLGPLAGVLAVGYGVGALLALAAWAARHGSVFGPGGGLSSGSVPLVHAGLALAVLGVAFSTYGAGLVSFDQGDPLVRGEPRSVGGHTVELVDGRVVDEDGNGRAETVSAVVHVREEGAFVSEETLTLSHAAGTGFTGRGSFVPEASPVTRGWWGDIAHNADTRTPLSIRLDGPGANETWVEANAPPPRTFPSRVEAVSMGVKRLPGVNLLWGGVAVLWVAMAARTVTRAIED